MKDFIEAFSTDLAEWVAGKLPPKVIYFAFFRFWGHATIFDEGANMHPHDIKWSKAIELWERKHGKVWGSH